MNAMRIVLTIACLTATAADSANAAPRFWKNSAGSGNWSVNTSWSGVSAAGADTVAAPVNGDTVSIAPTTDVARTITYNVPALSLVSLTVDLPVAGTNRTTFTMPAAPANSLTLTNGFIVGNAGRATFNQLSGTVNASSPTLDSVVGLNAGSNGIYNLSGGSLSVGHDLVVGTLGNSSGQFNQSGGTVNVVSTLRLGSEANSTGVFSISNTAMLSAGTAIVGGNGSGTLSIGDDSIVDVGTLNIGSIGTINLNGGTLALNSLSNVGTFNYTAGTIQLAGNRNLGFAPTTTIFGATPTVTAGKALVIGGAASLNSTFNVNGGALAADNGFTLGDQFSPTGTLNITGGGTVNSIGGVTMAGFSDSSAAATISGANSIWTTAGFTLANEGSATLNISSGGRLLNIGNSFMSLGFDGNSTATVTGLNSLWNVTGRLTVGGLNTSTLNIQNQGLVYVGAELSIGAKGVVNLDGGTIRFNTYFRFDNGVGTTGTFNFNTGTIQLANNRNIGTDLAIKDLFGATPTITAGKGLTVEETATISSALTLSGGTLRAKNLVVSAPFHFGGGLLDLTGGTITGLSSLAVPTSGEFRASGVQSLSVTGAAGSTITATGNLTLGNAAAVNGFGTQGILAVGANTVTLLDANEVVFDSLSLATLGSGANAGTLNAANGLTLDFGGNITGFGTVSTPNTIAKPLINNGHITGNSPAQRVTLPGYVKGVGTFDNVNFTGTFSPGFSPTILTVGNVALSATSTLIMELGGTAAGSGYDQIQSSGALAFDGTLQINLINDFTPTAGQSFDLFDFTNATGTFDTLQLPTLAGLAWNISQLYTSGIISLAAAGLSGDYNQNGIVDAADYTVWRNHLVSGQPLPNDDTPGVDQGDYTRWKNNFGQTGGSGLGANTNVAVPEPTTALLMVLAAAGVANRRRWCAWRVSKIVSAHRRENGGTFTGR